MRAVPWAITLLAACRAFPSDLHADPEIAADGGNASGDGGNGDGGIASPACSTTAEKCPTASLLVADPHPHRGLGVVSDRVVWSSQSNTGYEVKYCAWNDCKGTTVTLVSTACTPTQPSTGFFAVSNTTVYLSGAECRGWLCRANIVAEGAVQCGYNDQPLLRLAGDAAGVYGTGGNFTKDPIEETSLEAVAISGTVRTLAGKTSLGHIAANVGVSIATTADRVAWLESDAGSFSLRACSRDLGACPAPALLPPRSGTPLALAAGKTSFFVAYVDGETTSVLRVTPDGAETIATASSQVRALAADAAFVYFAESGGAFEVKRCPLDGPCTPEKVGNARQPTTFVAASPNAERLYLLAEDGLYVLPLR